MTPDDAYETQHIEWLGTESAGQGRSVPKAARKGIDKEWPCNQEGV